MSMKPRHAFSAALFALVLSVLFILPAHAQTSRFYFAGYFGLNDATDSDYTESSINQTGNFEYDNGYSFAGAFGLRINRQLRLEAEIGYNGEDIANANVSGLGEVNVNGELERWTYMLNAYYDLEVPWAVRPFVTAGAGIAQFNGDIGSASGNIAQSDDDAFTAALQVGGGLKYRLAPDLSLTGGYRYMTATDFNIGTYELDYDAHEIRVGLEWDIPVK